MPQIAENLEDVMDILKELQDNVYNKLHTEFKKDEEYYNLKFLDALGLPDEFKEDGTVLPTAREIIDIAVDHIAPAFRKVTVPRASATDKATEQAQALTDFYKALLGMWERGATGNPFRVAVKHLFTYGMACFKEQYDPSMIPKKPIHSTGESDEDFSIREKDFKEAKSSIVPLKLEVIHPTEIFPDPWNAVPQFFIQVSKMTVAGAIGAFAGRFERNGLRLTDPVDVIEYWDMTKRALFVDTTPKVTEANRKVLQNTLGGKVDEGGLKTHGAGGLPYVLYDSGLGIEDSEHKPEYKFVGMIRFLRSMLEAESRGYSINEIVLKMQSFPGRVASGDNTDSMEDFKIEFGMIKVLPSGVIITDVKPQVPPNELRQHVADTTSRIERVASPRSVRGVQDPGVSTGFQQQLITGQARLRYGSVGEAFSHLLEGICKIAARLVERKVKGKLSLVGFAEDDEFTDISPRIINGHHALRIEINVADAEDEIRKHQDATSLVAANVWTRRHAIKTVSPEVNPNRMFAGIIAENMVLNPTYLQFLTQFLMQDTAADQNIDDLLLELAQLGATEGEERPTERRTPSQGGEEGGVTGSREEQAQLRNLDLRSQG